MWQIMVDCVWNVMTHAQKPDFDFWRNGPVHLNRRGRQFSRLLAAEVCPSVVVMLDKPCSEVVWRVLATHFIRHFPLHFPSRASPCPITFQLDSTAIQAIDDNAIWRMHFACWLTKATDTHSEYLIVIAVPLQEWLHEGTSILRYIFDICFVNFVLLKRPKGKVAFSFTAQHFEIISV